MRRLCLILFLLPLPLLAQVRVSTNIAHMLSLQPSPTQPWIDVEGYERPADWGSSKRFRWDATNTLATNAVTIAFPGRAEGRYVHAWDGDIRAFGIVKVGDSSAADDNAAAWRQMVDFATKNGQSDHAKIRLPPGQLYYSGDLWLYNSQVSNPGADFFSGRMSVEGAGPEQSWIILTGATNNGLVVIQGRVVLKDFCISSTSTRRASTNLLTSLQTGNGIFVRQVNTNTGYPAHAMIENVFIRDQPAAGIFFNGGAEQWTLIDVVAHDNGGPGFLATTANEIGGNLSPQWHQMYMSCRALRNGRGGFVFTNTWNTMLLNCQSLNNISTHGHVVFASGRNNHIINLNTETQDVKIGTVSPVTATNLVITFNTFTIPGYDPEAAGVLPGMNLVVSGSVNNDRYHRITAVNSTTITTSAELGSTPAESSTNAITLEFTYARVGVHLNSMESTKVSGGYFGTLVVGGVIYNSTNTTWDSTVFANANIANWHGDVPLMFAGGASSNNIIRINQAPNPPEGYRALYRDIGFNQNNSVWYGANPQSFVVGNDGLATTLNVKGGAGGAPVMTLDRTAVGKVGFTVSSSAGYSRLQITDPSNSVQILNAQGHPTLPSLRIGNDGYVTATYSNVLVAPGRIANTITAISNGVHMTVAGGGGTGMGEPGVIKLSVLEQHPTAGTQQDARRDILGVKRTGVIITDGAGTLGTNLLLGLDDFSSNQVFSVRSTTKLSSPFPFMSTAQKLAIGGTSDGLVYDTTLDRVELRRNGAYYSIPRQVYFTATVDFDSIAAGGFGFGSITSTAANTNDCIVLCKDLSLPISVEAAIATNGVILLRAFNPGGSPADPPNSTYEGWIVKK